MYMLLHACKTSIMTTYSLARAVGEIEVVF